MTGTGGGPARRAAALGGRHRSRSRHTKMALVTETVIVLGDEVGVLRAGYTSWVIAGNRYGSRRSGSASARPMTNDANEHSFPAVTSITRLAR
jgi:hypothetical protein